MPSVQTEPERKQEFPPDERLGLPENRSFTWLLTAVVVVFAVIDLARVGFPATPVPYDYPFVLGIVYLLFLIQMLPRVHSLMDGVKRELVDIAERTATDDPVTERDTDVDGEQIQKEFATIMNKAFHPYILIGSALFGGAFTVVVMAAFDVLAAYPYLLTNFAYGAAHGLFYAPIVGTAWLVVRISQDWIVDIDLLDPDGMGGYRKIGDAVVTLVIYVIAFVTLDFLIISSVSYVDNAPFQDVALWMYFGMLLFYGVFTIGAVHFIRKRLLDLREQKTEMMRRQFREVEQRYWEKQKADEDTRAEAEHIRTMQVLFSRLHQMGLWPINLWSLFRLAISAAFSLSLVAIQEGWFPGF